MTHSSILPFITSGGSDVVSGGDTKPRILYDNHMVDGSPTSITADSEPDPVNYPYQNAYDDRPYTYWRVAAGTRHLTCVFPSARTVTGYAIYATTLAAAGATIQLQYSLDGGGSWLDYEVPEAPTDTSPIYRSRDAVSAARWRWEIVCATDVYIGVLSFGEEFVFQRGTWVGFSPPLLARDTTLTNNMSQGGNWLGRTRIRNGAEFQFDLDRLTAAWVRTVWYPFVLHAETRPWFLLWNKGEYPAEAAFCWSEGAIQKPSNSHPNFMRAGMSVCARTDAE